MCMTGTAATIRTRRPVCMTKMQKTTTTLRGGLRPTRNLDLMQALQTLRACDIVDGVPEGIVICMPETAADAAQVVLDRIQRTVSAVIRPHLTMKAEIFSSADIERLLTEIR